MRRILLLLTLFSLVTLEASAFAQLHFSGFLQTSLFSWETTEENQLVDYYETVQLRVTPQTAPNFYLNTYFRFARRGKPADWRSRFYNFYLGWKNPGERIQLRIGRQFIFHGVLNGTIDGILFSARLNKKISIKILGGITAPQDRAFELQNLNDNPVLGGHFSFRFSRGAKLELSYFQKSRAGNTIWQQAGIALLGSLNRNLYYQALLDYNLKTESYQGMRYRLTYYFQEWSFSGEYNSQRPRVFEDSFFKIFQLQAYHQFRGQITYQLGNYQLGFQHLYTMYEEDNTNQFILTMGSGWGIVGLVSQNGFGGENTGVYGEINYKLFPTLTLRLYSSFYNYQRHAVEIGEDATSFSGGVYFRPEKQWLIRTELQESINSFYKNDTRFLLQVNYFIRQ